MRKTAKIPRIIQIIEVKRFKVHCVFNNGEYRVVNFEELFTTDPFITDPFLRQLTDPVLFSGLELKNGTLVWPQLTKKIKLSNGMEFDTPLDLDPVVLYEQSTPDERRNQQYFLGELLKKARTQAGLTQEELAYKSGTTKNYISRIENNKSDIELGTLRKIIEIGLGKKLEINIG
ncbi:MAG: helix-turn-helix transcriptional regulator [Saprospirales bacterium]|nr:helix-turn-helix transcriptional regulator [Saprospirales bacterium]